MRPLFSTKIWSALRMVLKRCATVMVVRPTRASCTAFCSPRRPIQEPFHGLFAPSGAPNTPRHTHFKADIPHAPHETGPVTPTPTPRQGR